MSLRDRLRETPQSGKNEILATFGVLENPFPASNQTFGNPHYPIPEDEEAEESLVAFFREGRSQVLVILGTQGVGKTNFLNHLESEILEARDEDKDYYVVRYMADPEPSFDGIIRTIFQELGSSHLKSLGKAVAKKPDSLAQVRSLDLRQMLSAISKAPDDDDMIRHGMEWLLGFRVLNAHRNRLNISFRLDTVESRTSVLRDYVLLSAEMSLLKGIFLLLDELEKQAGVLGPTAVVRYLSAMRAIIDALPKYMFLIIAITPDAMRRYSSALPAFRSRLENQIALPPLRDFKEAKELAAFYDRKAHEAAKATVSKELVTEEEMQNAFAELSKISQSRGDSGVRQREFLNKLHQIAEERIQGVA